MLLKNVATNAVGELLPGHPRPRRIYQIDDNPDDTEVVTCFYVKVRQVSFDVVGGSKPNPPTDEY